MFRERYKPPPHNKVWGRVLATQRFCCSLRSPGSLFCYVVRGKQLQKSLNLAATERELCQPPGAPKIIWAGGVIDCSTWGSTPLTLHQLATRLYLICSLSTDCGKLHTYDVALLRPLGAITTCHSLHLKRTFAVYTHIHTHTHNSFSNGSFSAASHRVWYALPSHLWQGKNYRCYCIIITIIILRYTTLHTFNGPFSGTTQVSRC